MFSNSVIESDSTNESRSLSTLESSASFVALRIPSRSKTDKMGDFSMATTEYPMRASIAASTPNPAVVSIIVSESIPIAFGNGCFRERFPAPVLLSIVVKSTW